MQMMIKGGKKKNPRFCTLVAGTGAAAAAAAPLCEG
jgi:hypothetical protein